MIKQSCPTAYVHVQYAVKKIVLQSLYMHYSIGQEYAFRTTSQERIWEAERHYLVKILLLCSSGSVIV